MIGMDSDHCRIVSESLRGQRDIDDHTFAALEVLYERLERVKKINNAFSGISFSPEAMKLQKSRRAVAVG